MSARSWIVDPSPTWRENHRERFPDANLPEAPPCPATLMGERCALVSQHLGSHVLVTRKPEAKEA